MNKREILFREKLLDKLRRADEKTTFTLKELDCFSVAIVNEVN
jgi:hypothetical protein